LIRLKAEEVPSTFRDQKGKVIQKIFEDFLATLNELPFPTDAEFREFVKTMRTASSANTPPVPVTVLDKEDIAQVLNAIENSDVVVDLDEIAPSQQTSTMHKSHTISNYSFALSSSEEGNETRGRRSSSGSASKPFADGLESEDAEAHATGDATADTPRKSEKHQSTRVRASAFFKKVRQSLSVKKRGHISADGHLTGQTGDEEGNSSGSSAGTPTSTVPPPQPQPNQLQQSQVQNDCYEIDNEPPR